MLKKLSKISFGLILFLLLAKPAFAQEKVVNIYFFWGDGCPHCANEKPFLEELEKKYPEVKVNDFETWGSSENRKLLIEVGNNLGIKVSGVPFTVVGEKHFTGWLSEETTGKDIENAVQLALANDSRDIVDEILASVHTPPDSPTQPVPDKVQPDAIPAELNLPIIGKVNPKNLSLPVLTVVLGGLDGFNPCAMWTLLFLISLLLGMKDKKRRWILGTAFIVASAFVYFLFMAAWLNLLLFIGFIVWVRILIGIVAIGGGGYNLKEFFTNKDSGCKVTGGEKRKLVFEKLKNITHQKQFFIALGGIILLAFAVNLVELICSAGLPVVFTQILTLSNLAQWQYYAYMLLYILVFMLDDLFVFFTAMITLEMTGISTKYSRVSHLIGGILMLIVGLLLIFKPELLMFG
ncbi:MAG: TlpA family protein disulfide reductase [Patescibacteria group bacterium]